MSCEMPILLIDSVRLPDYACLDITQTLEEIGGYTRKRKLSGALVEQRHWDKLRTEVSAQSTVPPGVEDMVRDQEFALSCIQPMVVNGASTTIVIPAARRSDTGYTPVAHAIVDGVLTSTSISISTNTCTLGTVSGADSYRVTYWPVLTMRGDVNVSFDRYQGLYNWTLTAEEV